MEIKNQPKCRLKNFNLKSNLICNTITEGGYRECPYNLQGVRIRQVILVTGKSRIYLLFERNTKKKKTEH